MRNLLLKIINWKLKLVAKSTLRKYKPKIVGVTGTVGKTSTKNAIYAVLHSAGVRVRMAGGNLNNETGLPLAIIGDYKTPGGLGFLLKAILKGFFALLSGNDKYPEVLILEYAADHPGDLDYLIKIAKPDVAVVTAIGEIPVHSEFYSSTEEIVKEKSKLVAAVPAGGAVILNADDGRVLEMSGVAKAKVKTFGFDKESDLRMGDFKNILVGGFPKGISFSLKVDKSTARVSVRGVLGKSHAYSCAAGAAVGLVSGLTLNESAKALTEYSGEKGRGKIIEGVNGAVLIDESYNASPDSTRTALETLRDLRVKRRVAVLGDMLELGRQSEKAHRQIGAFASSVVDLLITVGEDSHYIAEEARKAGLDQKNIFHFEKPKDAAIKLKEVITQGDAVLIKGSQSIRTEKIVKEVMLRPADSTSLLVRQYGKWLRS
ncbi:MAG: UDP-N-acetylmuramoyl-tripeptide--D-alanyl-D-alanine ligase [Candidatus Colwellbacteria bacterium]|nr:UDP-N-acetylmuramoyl-tripeptide--D-alanyl-D-alanine ligase [Candidatus Colwellbacteria bacterium]